LLNGISFTIDESGDVELIFPEGMDASEHEIYYYEENNP